MNSRPVKSRLGFKLRQFSQIIRTRLSNELAEIGLTPVWLAALGALAAGNAKTGAELARFFSTDATAVTRTIDRMQAAGLVIRERSETDRRVFEIVVTQKGRDLLPKGQKLADENERLFFSQLDEDQRNQFQDTLDSLIDHASTIAPNLDWEN